MTKLSDEMGQWEIHALRDAFAAVLAVVRTMGMDNEAHDPESTPTGVKAACEQIFEVFERNHYLALVNPDFRRASAIRANIALDKLSARRVEKEAKPAERSV